MLIHCTVTAVDIKGKLEQTRAEEAGQQEKARCLKDCPALLGIEGHPAFEHLRQMKPANLRRPLCEVIYRCNMEELYRNSKGQAKSNTDAQNQDKKIEEKLLGKTAAAVVSEENVIREAMHAHFFKQQMAVLCLQQARV